MTNALVDAMRLSASEFAEAIRRLDAAHQAERLAESDRRDLEWLGIRFGEDEPAGAQSESAPEPPPGTVTGTTTSTKRAPAPSSGGSDALSMTDAEWRSWLKSLR